MTYKLDGTVYKIGFIDKGLTALPYQLENGMWVSESDLEPYTEPDTDFGKEVDFPTKNESRNLLQNIANCDKQLDTILKDSFSKERRLNIAATIMAGVMANSNIIKSRSDLKAISDEWLASRTLELADALISKCEEGGKHEKAQ